MNRSRFFIAISVCSTVFLSACVATTTDTAPVRAPATAQGVAAQGTAETAYTFRTNAELRAVLQGIDRRCSQQHRSDRQGSATMSRLVGGSAGAFIASAARSSADARLRDCRREYDRVAAIGRQRGLTADPRREAQEAQNRAAAAILRAVVAAPAQPSGSRSGSECGANVSREACNIRRQEEMMARSRLHRGPLD